MPLVLDTVATPIVFIRGHIGVSGNDNQDMERSARQTLIDFFVEGNKGPDLRLPLYRIESTSQTHGPGSPWRMHISVIGSRPQISDILFEIANDTMTNQVMLTVRGYGHNDDHPLSDADINLYRLPLAKIAKSVGLMDGPVPISDQPILVNTNQSLYDLKHALESKARQLPLVLLTQHYVFGAPLNKDSYSIDPFLLAKHTFGVAHVVIMPNSATMEWSDLVGKKWSAFMGGVRTYRPNLDFNADNPFAHQLATLDAIKLWKFCEWSGRPAFAKFMEHQLQRKSTSSKRVGMDVKQLATKVDGYLASLGGPLNPLDPRKKLQEYLNSIPQSERKWPVDLKHLNAWIEANASFQLETNRSTIFLSQDGPGDEWVVDCINLLCLAANELRSSLLDPRNVPLQSAFENARILMGADIELNIGEAKLGGVLTKYAVNAGEHTVSIQFEWRPVKKTVLIKSLKIGD